MPMKNKWLLGFMFLSMLMMGSVYSYSVYRPFIENRYEISTTVSGTPYMFSLFFYALSMYGFGKIMNPSNLKLLSFIGSLLLTLGFLLSAIAPNITLFTLGYGVLMGVAVGIIYGLILSFIQSHFKSNTGLISGVMLFGFGLSSVFVAPLAQSILETYSLSTLFLGLMGLSLVASLPLYFLLEKEEATLKEASNERAFKEWRIFFLTTIIGLTAIGLTGSIGSIEYGFNAGHVAILVGGFAFLNAISRIIFGYLMDRFGFKRSATISFGLLLIASLINLTNQGESILLFSLGYGIYWFSLGSWLSMMPSYIKKKYGIKAYASIYGKVFTAYGVSAIMGTLLSGIILDMLESSQWIYLGIIGIIAWGYIEVNQIKNHTQ